MGLFAFTFLFKATTYCYIFEEGREQTGDNAITNDIHNIFTLFM
jgi:hypothetical protein